MKNALRQLWLICALIAAAAAVLLLSDLRHRGTSRPRDSLPSIAIMQFLSAPILDLHVDGIRDRLRERGYVAEGDANLKILNPQGDYGVANAIARELVQGPYEMLITSSTVALQIVAKANQEAKKRHVFGAVTDPCGTGVGITGPAEDQHPPYLAGIGTFQPVEEAFRVARLLKPNLKRVGVVWNPAEQCSEACLKKARVICGELGIQLLEANASNTTEVKEAADSLLAKDAEAIWIGGDTTVISTAPMLIRQAAAKGAPVFTNDPKDTEYGALFGIGADYYKVGQYTGDVAADILDGRSPDTFRIENVVPETLAVNQAALDSLEGWNMAPEVEKRLATVEAAAEVKRPAAPKPFRILLAMYNETQFAEDCARGVMEGLAKGGLTEGTDFSVRRLNAQGDMATLSSVMASVRSEAPDLLVAISTPCLQAALRQAGEDTTIIFTGVGDAVRAGAGKSETDHLPNVTGITTRSPFEGMARLIQQTLPHAKAVGTLFTPAEINSELYREWFEDALAEVGIALIAVPVTASADTAQAAATLCQREIHAIAQIVDNTTRPGFGQIAAKASVNGLPVYVFDSSQMKDGATLCLARDYYDSGVEAAEKALRVLHGESPADIPFTNTQSEKLLCNLDLATRYGLVLTDELRAAAKSEDK